MGWGKLKWLKPRAKFYLWYLRNPGRSFKTCYADSVVNSISSGKEHASLGANLKRSGAGTFAWLLAQGIQPNDLVVDYGCGTLRIGGQLIKFLEAERYVGLDI